MKQLNSLFINIFLFLYFLFAISNVTALKIGYAFSGGGARGFAHIGMLKVLEKEGIRPDYISGTSIGAVIGALYSMGYSAAQIESLSVNMDWDNLLSDDWNRQDLYIGQKRWSPYGNASFRLDEEWKFQLPQSIIIGNKINLELFRIFYPSIDITDFSHLPIPFNCIATDLISGKAEVFSSGSLLQAVRASMSIPSILQPFPYNNNLYIDGGISQNLPGKLTKNMGADYVIGFKVNSSLRKKYQLKGLLHILDQTINISMTNQVNEELSYCDLLLNPEMEGYLATDFHKIKQIILEGENYAKKHIEEIRAFKKNLNNARNTNEFINLLSKKKENCLITSIIVQGNEYLSSSKIKEFVGLKTNTFYSVDQIIDRFYQAWNSQLFDIIYPVLSPYENGMLLTIIVKERERKYVTLNFSYDRDDLFVASGLLALQNYILKNSHFFAEVKLGGRHELNIDFVKNFGQSYGIYYRIFPYINEKNIYIYNEEHLKEQSVISLEYGITTGLGIFARKSIVLEGYGYSYQTKLYRDISNVAPINTINTISGLGLKVYHESLDDFTFPTQGAKSLFRLSSSRKGIISDKSIDKLQASTEIYLPIQRYLSLFGKASYGTHFQRNVDFSIDPFYLGGQNGFTGYPQYDVSGAHYELLQGGIITNPIKKLYVITKLQCLGVEEITNLSINQNVVWGGVLEIGLKNDLGPMRLTMAVSQERKPQIFLTFGYTQDFFHFSRR